jgi:hypothetical protein
MANSKRKCKSCGEYVRAYVITPKGVFCNIDSAVKYSYANKSKGAEIQRKEQKKKDIVRKKELLTRSQWYQKLQTVVNKYVRFRDKDKSCCSCGACGEHLKYDAGHYIAVGSNMDLRFELTNIHLQCSVKCNQFGRGMPVEYGEFIKAIYGVGHYHWLHTNYLCHKPHPTLKELFPTHHNIELEIIRYKQKIKDLQ